MIRNPITDWPSIHCQYYPIDFHPLKAWHPSSSQILPSAPCSNSLYSYFYSWYVTSPPIQRIAGTFPDRPHRRRRNPRQTSSCPWEEGRIEARQAPTACRDGYWSWMLYLMIHYRELCKYLGLRDAWLWIGREKCPPVIGEELGSFWIRRERAMICAGCE